MLPRHSQIDANATLLSGDGIGAFDLISKKGWRWKVAVPSSLLWDSSADQQIGGTMRESHTKSCKGGEQGASFVRIEATQSFRGSERGIVADCASCFQRQLVRPVWSPSCCQHPRRLWRTQGFRFIMARRSIGQRGSQRGVLTAATQQVDPDAIVW